VNVPPPQGEGDRRTKRDGGGASPQAMPPNVQRARKLRREMSYPEVLLWQRLRGSPNGIKFRRQHPVGSDYTADFFCAAACLVIEIDGAVHDQPGVVAADIMRDRYMQSHGFKVVRIAARDVLRDADAVADAIVSLAATAPPPLACGERSPSPFRGG
jgi:very-short-patch-repair endonuclease